MLKLPMTDLLFYKCFDKELHVLICFKGLNFTRRPALPLRLAFGSAYIRLRQLNLLISDMDIDREAIPKIG
ncbi:unnamed protein product, partial [Mesorhabditis belari]|uniref:Uncharacterized protein n=1 Tax=Mesorhabditis belari TaxID=2138241 RepID=A0AAF3FAZ9_9BILA